MQRNAMQYKVAYVNASIQPWSIPPFSSKITWFRGKQKQQLLRWDGNNYMSYFGLYIWRLPRSWRKSRNHPFTRGFPCNKLVSYRGSPCLPNHVSVTSELLNQHTRVEFPRRIMIYQSTAIIHGTSYLWYLHIFYPSQSQQMHITFDNWWYFAIIWDLLRYYIARRQAFNLPTWCAKTRTRTFG